MPEKWRYWIGIRLARKIFEYTCAGCNKLGVKRTDERGTEWH